MSYTLYNIKFLSKNSGRYLRPDKKALFSILKPGNYAQLMLRSISDRPNFIGIEKVWVQIDRLESGQYFGKLITIPQVIQQLKMGDEIAFAYDYVIAARPGHSITNRLDMGNADMRCMVSESVLRLGQPIQYGVREMPTLYKDSGWRFFSSASELKRFPNDSHSVPVAALEFSREQLDVSLGTVLDFTSQPILADLSAVWLPRSSRA